MKAAELRQSILQAAVQGKLVPQNMHDEPASVLLKRIREEKARLVKESKIKKEKPLPQIAEDEIPYDLPDGWVWCHIGDISTVRGGKRIPKGMIFSKAPTEHIYIRVTDMKNGTISNQALKYIDDEVYKNISQYTISADDVYVTIAGTIGKCGIVPDKFDGMNLTENAAKLCYVGIDKQFLVTVISSDVVQEQFKEKTNQMAQPKLALERITSTYIPLPSLAEQQRIVAKVNELMALCDELEAAEKELDTLEKRFEDYLPKSILQAAVQGKLVPQNVHDESATELLKRIQQEKTRLVKEGRIKREKPLPPIAEDETPYDLPDGWVWCKLGEICIRIHYGYTASALRSGNVRMVRITDIQNNMVNWSNVPFCSMTDDEYETYGLQNDDILIARTGGTIGKTFLVTNIIEKAVFASYLIRVITMPIYDVRYLKYFLESPLYWEQLLDKSMGTGQPNVNGQSLSNLILPLPPLAEQQRIVAKVDELMVLYDELKTAKVFAAKPAAYNVVPFPQQSEDEEIFMVAQGEVSGKVSKELKQAQEDLFGDGADE